jgi:hypothetical protein
MDHAVDFVDEPRESAIKNDKIDTAVLKCFGYQRF